MRSFFIYWRLSRLRFYSAARWHPALSSQPPAVPQERRPERDGSLRVLYAARIGHCRSCPLRAQCQESSDTIKPRRVSAVLWPLESSLSTHANAPAAPPRAPVLWKDWPRGAIRQRWLKVV